MKRTKFNSDYCGDIIIIGFTGNAQKIHSYLTNLSKLFDIKVNEGFGLGNVKDEKFNLEVEPEVIAHIETQSCDRELLYLGETKKCKNCSRLSNKIMELENVLLRKRGKILPSNRKNIKLK